jgi:pimeloyl-ACP methyl ester carboxylesterase
MPRARASGLELEYESFGDPTHPHLLLVMGLAYQMIDWDDALCSLIAERGFRVTRFDNRDSGLSSKLDDLRTPDLLAVMSGTTPPPYRHNLPERVWPEVVDAIALVAGPAPSR